MTKDDWNEVENKLKSLWGSVCLNCDGYELLIRLERVGTYKNNLFIYVNGSFKGQWISEDCEERRRFLRPVKHALYSKRRKEKFKGISKRELREHKIDLDAHLFSYTPFWGNFQALKRHLIHNNKEIVLAKKDQRQIVIEEVDDDKRTPIGASIQASH